MNIFTAIITAIITSLQGDDEGQGLAEYALILALIAVVVIGSVILLGGQINGIMNDVGLSI